jgi:tetratricopeptide (TPR) repeat protein
MNDSSKLSNKFEQIAAQNLQAGRDLNIGNINQNINIPKSSAPDSVPQNIPYSGAARFVGRSNELKTLHKELQRTERVIISAISGMGGIGKTELAIQYAQQYIHNYSGGVCWLRARGMSINAQIVEFARLNLNLEVPLEISGEQLNLKQQVEWCIQHWHWSEKPVLLILDDVTHLADLREIAQIISKRFRVLVTTRQRNLDASFSELSLDILSPQEALELLATLIGNERIEREVSSAEYLCEWLGYLPLGLELIGRYLAEDPDLSLSTVLEKLETQRLKNEALDLDEQNIQEKYVMTAQRGVRAAFELTWQELITIEVNSERLLDQINPFKIFYGKKNTDASQVALLSSLFALEPFPWSLVELIAESLKWQEKDVENAKKNLYKRHLIQRVAENYYKVHPLIKEFLQLKLEKAKSSILIKQSFATLMARIGQNIFHCENYQEYNTFSSVISHMAEVDKSLTDFLQDDDLVWVFTGIGQFYKHGQLDFNLAEFWYKRCLNITQKRLGVHRNVADSFYNLGLLYEKKCCYLEAENCHVKALEIYEKCLGSKHPQIASSLTCLADIYFAQGLYDKAETLYMEGLKIREEVLGKEHPEVVKSIRGVMQLYFSQNRLHEAEFLLNQALNIRDSRLVEKYPDDVASLIGNLASIYGLQYHYEKSENLLLKSLEIWNKYGGISEGTVTALSNLASIYREQKRYSEATSIHLQAVELLQELVGEEHFQVAIELARLAETHSAMGKYDIAESTCLQALERLRNIWGKTHLDIANILGKLGRIYFECEQFSKAESSYQEALNILQSLSKNNNYQPLFEQLFDYINILGLASYKQGKYKQAEALYNKVLKIQKDKFGIEHTDTALIFHNLSALYDEWGKLEQAIPLCLKAQKIWEKTIGIKDPLFARSLDRLAGIYIRQDKLTDAKKLYEEALCIREETLGLEHPDTISTRQSLEKIIN